MSTKILNTPAPVTATPIEQEPPTSEPALTLSPLAVPTKPAKREPLITQDDDIIRIDY